MVQKILEDTYKTKNKKKIFLKNKVINSLLISGNKVTSEKLLLKSIKLLQKLTKKSYLNLLQLCILNIVPIFKMNTQKFKKGKRKYFKEVPSFIKTDSLRIMLALKYLKKSSAHKNTSFDTSFANEILSSAQSKSQTVEKKNELQKQILLKKKYLHKFRW
jgi:ribosomal protein S7